MGALPPPYWAFAWPGGQALARYILDNPEDVRGRTVLDFGAGSGLVAIAAAKAGASCVVAAETDSLALAAIDLNSQANGVFVEPIGIDIIGSNARWNTVLAGDMCYERPVAERLVPWLRLLVKSGVRVLLGDPGRNYFPGRRRREARNLRRPDDARSRRPRGARDLRLSAHGMRQKRSKLRQDKWLARAQRHATVWQRCSRGWRMSTEGEVAAKEAHELHRALGPWQLIALGIGAIIGAGIFVITGHAAATYAGPGVVISFMIAGLGCFFAGLCYAEFACMIPVAGSAYTYTYATMGRFLAWFIGWNLVLEYLAAASTVAVGWSGYFVQLLSQLGITIPRALSSAPLAMTSLTDISFTGSILNLPAMARGRHSRRRCS